jgi:ribonuclease HI
VKNPLTSLDLPQVEIYTDGGCEPNPGAGAYAAVLLHPKKRLEISGGFRKTTNNRMEILAAIAGLEKLQQPCKVTVYSDSQYLVNAIEDGWAKRWKANGWWLSKTERAKNVDLWDRLLMLCETHQVEFKWLKGHAGHQENERCDQLAMLALRQPGLPIDTGYETRPETEGFRPDPKEGDPCRKCSAPLIKRSGRFKPTRDYYYEFHLFCPKCQTTYHVESARRQVEQPPSLF